MADDDPSSFWTKMRARDLPAAWVMRVVLALFMALSAVSWYVVKEKMAVLDDLNTKIDKLNGQVSWSIGTVTGLQNQVNKSDQRIEKLYDALMNRKDR